jgi:hypothetical protein
MNTVSSGGKNQHLGLSGFSSLKGFIGISSSKSPMESESSNFVSKPVSERLSWDWNIGGRLINQASGTTGRCTVFWV